MFAQTFSKGFFLLFTLFVFILPSFVSAQVNINTAGLDELQTLQGIGPAYAQRIIDYRNANGPFQSIEGIMNVTGIGTVTFNNIKDFITVGSGGSGAEPPPVQTATSSTSSSTGSSSSSSSSSGVPTLRIGQDRTGMVGSPIEFRVEGARAGDRSGIFKWNFGDGTQGGGVAVNHVYEYPGEYVAVLSASFPEGEVVARVDVKIVESGVSITHASLDRVELTNNSQYEANLFGRALVTQGGVFAFPRDTIIKPGQKISFGSKITGIYPENINEVALRVFGENAHKAQAVVWEEEKEKMGKIVVLNRELSELQERLAEASGSIPAATPVLAAAPAQLASVAVAQNEGPEELEESETMLASAVSAVEFVERTGWWERFKRFFLRTGR